MIFCRGWYSESMMNLLICALCAMVFRVATETQSIEVVIGLYLIWGILSLVLPIRIGSVRWFLGTTVFMHLCCIGMPLILSDDLYRYLWEGQLVLQGGNPYVTPPDSFGTMDGVRELVNHPSIAAIYPPLAQATFAMVSGVSYTPISMQCFFASVDVCTAYGIWVYIRENHGDTRLAWLYAVHPLAIVESAGMAHLDGLAICLTIWGLNVYSQRHWFWFAAGGVKLFPLAMLPMLKEWSLRRILMMTACVLAAVWYFWDPSIVRIHPYVQHWSFNSMLYMFLSMWNGYWARLICIGLAGFSAMVAVYCVRNHQWSIVDGWFWFGATFVLLSPTVHPWYALWVWVPCLLQTKFNHWPWTWFVSLLPIVYVALTTMDASSGAWSPSPWPSLLIYTTLCSLMFLSKFVDLESWMKRLEIGTTRTQSQSQSQTTPVP